MKTLYTILFLLLCNNMIIAQNAFFRQDNIPVIEGGIPFINPWAGGINAALMSEIDLNGDGIKDLFVFDATNNRVSTFINNGTPNSVDYHFASEYVSKFPQFNKWVFLKDYNCDGREDIFCFSDVPGSVRVYRNDYSIPTGLQFTLITDQLLCTYQTLPDYVRATAETHPTFSDVDKDGDLDMLGWPDVPNGRVVYYQNKAVELGMSCDSLIMERVTDCWGKFQLAFGSNSVSAFNIPCAFKMADTDPDKPLVTKKDDTISSLFAIDIDGDNDDDLLIGDVGSPHSLLVVNGGTTALAQMTVQDTIFPSLNIPVTINSFINHAYIDVDNDGKKDLIASAKRENVNTSCHFYKDASLTSTPSFSYTDSEFLQRTMIDLGRAVYPSFFDYNSDGLMDLIVGNEYYEPLNNNITVGLALFKNIGTPTLPSFDLIDRNYADFNSVASGSGFGVACAPTFGDFDGDSDTDMMIGSENGQLFYFKNNPVGGFANFTLFNPFFGSIDVGNYSMPCAVDLDRDGLLDLVIGRRSGRLSYYRNTGTVTNPVFPALPTVDTLGGIILHDISYPVTGYAAPYIYDDSGTYKMFIGDEGGELLLYDSIEGNINGTWHLAKTIINKTEGKYTTVAANDLNNDGFIDLAVGNWSGGLGIFYQQNPSAIAEMNAENVFNFSVMPNPAGNTASIHIADKLIINNHLKLLISDQLGRTILNQNIQQNVTTINTVQLNDGIYYLKVYDENYCVTKKLVVMH
ncbi:MAG: FG-GAP-like repeat-containing protein [Bacteroidia bacterium]